MPITYLPGVKYLPKISTYTTAIPFDQPATDLGTHTVTGAIAFTKVIPPDPQCTFGAVMRLIADGTNTPDFSAFQKVGATDWDNTAGAVNRCIFFYDGSEYCVAFIQDFGTSGGGGGLTPLDPPDSPAISGTITDTTIPFIWNDIANETGYSLQIATNSGFTTGLQTVPKAAGSTSHTFTGLTPSTVYYIRAKSVGDGVTYSDSVYTTTISDTTAAGGGGSIDADAQAVIDAINLTAAGPLSGTDETDINDLVVAMKAAGTWTTRDLILIPVWADADANAINWKNPAISVNWQGGTTHPANGVSGVAISVNDLSAFAHVAQDSINLAVYLQTAPVPPALECYIGTQDSTNTAGLYYYTGPGGAVGGGFNNAEGSVGTLSPAAGYEAVNRIVSGQFTINRAGANALTKVIASTGVPTSCKLRVGAMGNNFGTQNYPGSAVWSAALAGGGQTGTEMTDEYTAIQGFMTARGIDV